MIGRPERDATPCYCCLVIQYMLEFDYLKMPLLETLHNPRPRLDQIYDAAPIYGDILLCDHLDHFLRHQSAKESRRVGQIGRGRACAVNGFTRQYLMSYTYYIYAAGTDTHSSPATSFHSGSGNGVPGGKSARASVSSSSTLIWSGCC